MSENEEIQVAVIPTGPYFHMGADGKPHIRLNGGPFPSKKWLEECLTELQELLKTSQPEIDEYERERKIRDEAEYKIWMEYGKEKKPYVKKPGYVYLLKSLGLYKIGKATNLKDRIKSYTTQNPHGIELITYTKTDDYTKLELEMHERFSDKRRKGEWFDLNEEDLMIAQAILIFHKPGNETAQLDADSEHSA